MPSCPVETLPSHTGNSIVFPVCAAAPSAHVPLCGTADRQSLSGSRRPTFNSHRFFRNDLMHTLRRDSIDSCEVT